jgi:hypothetical protein
MLIRVLERKLNEEGENGKQNLKAIQYIKTFQTRIGESYFLDRGVIFQQEIPIELKLAAEHSEDITPANYFTACDQFKNIALRQNGLIAGIDNVELTLNENVVTNVTQVARTYEMACEYYPNGDMSKFMPASQPDRFYDYTFYEGTGPQPVTTKNEVGTTVQIPVSPLNEENIFSGGYSNTYNSRKVVFAFDSSPDKSTVRLKAFLWCYIPFSIFSLSNSPFSLYGINTMTLNLGLKANFVKEIFVMKGTLFSTIGFNDANVTGHKSELLYKIYKAPDYITSAMVDKATGGIKPYRVGHSTVHFEPLNKVPSGGVATTGQISVGVVPKSVYLSIHAVKDQAAPWKTPNFKGRIKQIVAQVGSGEVTIGPSALRIFDLCRSNGLAKDYESAMFTNGAVVRLDLSKDLSIGSTLIGANMPLTLSFSLMFDDLTPTASATQYELRCMLAFAGQVQYKDRAFTPIRSLVLSSVSFSVENQAAALYGESTPEIMTIGAGFFGDIWSGIKNIAKKGFNWVKDNPEEAFGLVRKGIKLATGAGHVPHVQTYGGAHTTVIGGSDTMILGAGDDSIFK